MSIYSKSTKALMRDMVTELGLKPGDILQRQQVLSWFRAKYPKIKTGTVSCHVTRMSTNAPSRIHWGVRSGGDDDLFYQLDPERYRLYEPDRDPPPIYEKQTDGAATVESEPGQDEPCEEPSDRQANGCEFAYEKDLQNFLAKNLSSLEEGLRLYEDEAINGIEFPVGGRSIDILAVDKNNAYVVIELKVSRGYDRVVGQILRYMAWIRKHHAEAGQKVRGIVVAREISEDIMLACSEAGNIDLFEYQLSVSLKRVALD